MKIICKCGCKKQLNLTDKYGRKREYIHGHHSRGKKLPKWRIDELKKRIGSKNPMYGRKWSKKQRRILSKTWLGRKHSKETIRKCSLAKKGIKFSKAHRKKISLAHKGMKYSLEHRMKISEGHKGNKSSFWRGGITKKNQLIRRGIKYANWRKQVFERDKYTCVLCGDDTSGNLEADHIKPFSIYKKLRFVLSNGRTLCKPCHRKTDTYGRKSWKQNYGK